MPIKYFKTQMEFRQWLERNHDKSSELWVGLHKRSSNKPSVSYKEAVDEALCFGWIDGVRKSVNESSYTIRFTPRKPLSIWSRINIKRANELKELGRMKPSGLRAFEGRDPKKADLYSFENQPRQLDPEFEKRFKRNKKAWAFFEGLPPFFKKTSVFWIMSAKREGTRLRRLETFMDSCARGERLGVITAKKNEVQ